MLTGNAAFHYQPGSSMPNHTILRDSHKLDLICLHAETQRITIAAATTSDRLRQIL